jgi:hypothetical protein
MRRQQPLRIGLNVTFAVVDGPIEPRRWESFDCSAIGPLVS